MHKHTFKKLHKKTKKILKKLHKVTTYLAHHVGLLILSVVFIIMGLGIFWISSLKIPNLDSAFDERREIASTKIYDRTGEVLLFDVHKDIKRTPVPYDEINQYAKDAVIAIEDDQFYEHAGIDVRATTRAITYTMMNYLNLSNRPVQGGSTITQQVIKNTLLVQDKRFDRKFKEWALALKLEQIKNKDEILEIYLNEIPYGGEIYGIQEASQTFFGKDAVDLSLAESAYMAAVINAPTLYSPYGNNRDRLDDRKDLVLNRMEELGMITPEEHEEALAEEVEFLPRSSNTLKAPHFVQYIREQLEERYGADIVTNGGLSVITTLDYDLQQQAEQIIRTHAEESQELWDASNAALVAIQNNTGQILTMVGSRNYFDSEVDGSFNAALGKRQPGSSFKPFIYAAAFEAGYTDETVLFDTKTQFTATSACQEDYLSSNGECYSPSNYDGEYLGPLTLRNALAQSRNVPAVKLLYLVGIDKALQTARRMGITTLNQTADHYGLTLVLGGGEVTLLDITSAYGAFGSEGVHHDPVGIIEVRDKTGKVIEEYGDRSRKVLSAQAANTVASILSDNVARTPLFGAYSALNFGNQFSVGGKTGTTNDNRDGWMVGFTTEVSVGVWSGNSDNSPMKKGSSISLRPWRDFMDVINADPDYQPGYFAAPPTIPDDIKAVLNGVWQGSDVYYIDSVSGKLATEFTPEETKQEVIPPDPHNILHWVNKRDPRGPIPENPASDAQYSRWEYSVRKWVSENYPELLTLQYTIPTEYDDVHTSATQPDFIIEAPVESSSFTPNETITVIPSITKLANPLKEVRVYFDNILVGKTSTAPYTFSFTPTEVNNDLSPATYLLAVEVVDTEFNTKRIEYQIEIKN
jgi:1A family penicillin-binding protein